MSVLGHAGPPPTPPDVGGAWDLEPSVVTGLALVGLAYARGTSRRTRGGRRLVTTREIVCFWAGMAILGVALVSPLSALGEALFAAHMVQHLLLVLVAAPLLALGAPLAPVLWGLPAPIRRGVMRAWPRWAAAPFRDPVFVWVLHTVVLWAWHLPPLYEAAVRSEPLHALEHASFLATGYAFWAVLFRLARRGATRQGVGIAYVFLSTLQSGILGALMALAAEPWYAVHATTTAPWGLTPLEDQQLAGLIMWVPASFVYLAAGLFLVVRWIEATDAAVQRRERAYDATSTTAPATSATASSAARSASQPSARARGAPWTTT